MVEIFGHISGARVFHGPQPEAVRPDIGDIDGMSAGEMTYEVPEDKVEGLAQMEIRQAMARYEDIKARQGALTPEESRELGLLLLEAEDVVYEISRWSEEHPKFLNAVHGWVERGYNQAHNDGKQTSRLDVLRSIRAEFETDNDGPDQEPAELFLTLDLVEREYEISDALERLDEFSCGAAVSKIGSRTVELANR